MIISLRTLNLNSLNQPFNGTKTMKLYSTTKSERASKSQGGNKQISFEFTVGDKHEKQTILFGSIEREETETEDIYRLWNGDIQADKIVIPKKAKGKKQ